MSIAHLVLFTFLTFSTYTEAQSAVNRSGKSVVDQDKKQLHNLKKKVDQQSKEVEALTKEVNNIEIALGMNNKKYLQLAQDRAAIEEKLTMAKKNSQYDQETLEKNYIDTKKVLMGVLLNKLENTDNAADILARKILVRKLQAKLTDLEALMGTNTSTQKNVEALYAQLEESMNVEKDLLNLMSTLEDKKVNLRVQLEEKSKTQNNVKAELDGQKNKLAMAKKNQEMAKARNELAPLQLTEEIKVEELTNKKRAVVASSTPSKESGDFISPIATFLGMEYQKKGVTFNFKGKNKVRATKDAKVVYTGALANYGNVLMIDHGNDTRSVILGQFEYTVKKGDAVKASEIVGMTMDKVHGTLSDGKLYFEVRKNNLAQNTYLLLDKNAM